MASAGAFSASLGKRALGMGRYASCSPSGSDEEAALALGLRRSEGSTAKRRRSAASSPSWDQSGCNLLAGPLHDNPLFSDADCADEDEQYDAEHDVYWHLPSDHSGKENTPLLQQGGPLDDSQDEFAEFTPATGHATLLSSFLHELNSPQLRASLTNLQRLDMHPVGDGPWATVEVTIAGLLVLCRRAGFGPDEMSPELLLTCLWLLMSGASQYRAGLEYCSHLFLDLLPDAGSMIHALRADMVSLQVQVLKRCSWRVLLLDGHELHDALGTLGNCPGFAAVVDNVLKCAKCGWMPVGSHSPATQQAILRTVAAGGRANRGKAAAGPPPAPHARCIGGSRPGTSHDGLDGSYWQPADAGRRSGGRQALAPRNTRR